MGFPGQFPSIINNQWSNRRLLSPDRAWISDESSLWDIHSNETNELFYAKSWSAGLMRSEQVTGILRSLKMTNKETGNSKAKAGPPPSASDDK
jgi:hypothetical protein